MGFLGELFEAVRDFHEGLCDIAEYATVGFVEEVIKDNGPYKTSYEKREEAEYVASAANRRLNDACDSLNKSVDRLNDKIRSINDRKRGLLSGMKCGVSVMPCRISPSYSSGSYGDLFDEILNHKSDPFSTSIRISRANEYLGDAHSYSAECSEKVARINNMKVRLSAVEDVLNEESRLLDILERSRNDPRFSGDNKFAEQLRQLLEKHICNTDGELDRSYVQSIECLKSLCNRL